MRSASIFAIPILALILNFEMSFAQSSASPAARRTLAQDQSEVVTETEAESPVEAPAEPPAAPPAGKKVKRPKASNLPPAPPVSAPPKSRLRAAVSVYYSTGGDIEFDRVTLSGGGASTSGKTSFALDPAFGITAEVSMVGENNLGFSLGASYDMPRDINSVTSEFEGERSTEKATSPKSTLAFATLFGNFLAEVPNWNVYFPIGLNLSFPKLKRSSVASGTSDISGGLGFQGGIGFRFSEHFSVEALVRYLSAELDSNVGGISGSYREGSFTTVNVGTKVTF